MDLLLVRKDGEQFYCPPEQADYWASMGYEVFEFSLVKVAGPDNDTNAVGVGFDSTLDNTSEESTDSSPIERG